MRVEVLYFEGCPHHKQAVHRLRETLQEEGVAAAIIETEVLDQATAEAAAFPGSPTIKIDGMDVEPSARTSQAYAVACRTYHEGGKREGLPSKEMLRAAIREALGPHKSGEKKSSALVMAGSIFAAILASFCCILPIVFALTGLTVVGASAAFAAWRPYLLTATFGLLAAAFYFAYRPAKDQCAPGSACAMPIAKRSGRVFLWLTSATVVAFALFPYYSGPVAEFLLPDKTARTDSSAPAVRHASFRIEGMDCAACATAIEGKLKDVAGAGTVRVSFERKAAEVDYNPAKASPEQFRKAIEETGYQAVKTNRGV